MKHILPLACCALVAAPAPLLAQSTVGGEIKFELGRNTDKSRNFKHAEMALGTTFASGIGAQVDMSIGKYENFDSTQPSAGVHLYYELDDTLTLGGFALGEDQRPGNYFIYGVEAAYDTGAVAVEAYGAYRKDVVGTDNGMRFGLSASYAPQTWNGFGVFGGGHLEDGLPAGDKSVAYVGSSYAFSNNTGIALKAGRTDIGENVFSLSYDIKVGDGTKFSRRDNLSTFGAY